MDPCARCSPPDRYPRADRRRVAARGQVGRRAGARRRHATAVRTRLTSRNENDVTVAWPELNRAAARRPRPAGRRRGHRAQRARPPRLPGAPGPDARAQRRGRPRGSSRPAAGDLHGLRPAAARRRGPAPPAAGGAPRAAATGSAWSDSTWQVPAAYDDGADAVRRHPAAGARGHRQQAAHARATRFGARSQDWLKFAHRHRALVRRRRLAPAGGHRATGWPRCWSASRPPTACSTAAGSAAASAARPAACSAALLAPLARTDSPFDDEVPAHRRARHPLGRARCWSSTSTPTALGYDRLRQPSYRGVRNDLTPRGPA